MPRAVSSSSSSSEDEDPGPEAQPEQGPVAADVRRTRTTFQCPADFVSFSYKPCRSSVKATSSSSELWLIKAPANFDPQCFSGLELPLCGLQTLSVPSAEGAELTYSVLGSSGRSPELRLLTPPEHDPDHASLASPFTGLITVCQSYGQRATNPAVHAVPAVPPPSLPPGLKPRFEPTACRSAALPTEGHRSKKKRKRIKTEPEEPCVRVKVERADTERADPVYGQTQGAVVERAQAVRIKVEHSEEERAEAVRIKVERAEAECGETQGAVVERAAGGVKTEVKHEPLDLHYAGEESDHTRKKKKKKKKNSSDQ
ncbi:hypothetical protein WMY93_028208 [Mugilogobius chulae]|uniref:CD3e molecule, epsilon associated protein n=1 Tax=Mugilogobius chulae TaxID=88201 RepID=A0AAW0MWB4_9GOBI